MSFRLDAKVMNSDEMVIEVRFNASLKELRALKEKLASMGWPASDLNYALTDLILKIDKHFSAETQS